MSDRGSEAPSLALAPPPGHPRFPLLDGLRGLGFVMVVVAHAGGYTEADKFVHFGQYLQQFGVALVLFFALSGFLMYRPFVAARRLRSPEVKLGDYGRRRVLRVLPAYWVALTVLLIYPGLWGVTQDPFVYYGLVQNLPPFMDDECATGCGIPQAWTLSIEATFYALLPVMVLLVGRLTRGASRRRWLATEVAVIGGLGALSLLLPLVFTNSYWLLTTSLPGAFVWIGAGMLLAVASVATHGREDSSRVLRVVTARPWIAWGVALGLFILLANLELTSLPGAPDETRLRVLGYNGFAVAIVILLMLPTVFGTQSRGLLRRVLSNRVVVWIGVVSYGGYLFHLAVIGELDYHGAGTVFGSHEFITLSVFAVAISCAFGAASYYLVEMPFLRLKNRRLSDLAPVRRLRLRLAPVLGRAPTG